VYAERIGQGWMIRITRNSVGQFGDVRKRELDMGYLDPHQGWTQVLVDQVVRIIEIAL